MALASVYRFAYHTGDKLNKMVVLKTATYAIIGTFGGGCTLLGTTPYPFLAQRENIVKILT
jgi:hypothetical protein